MPREPAGGWRRHRLIALCSVGSIALISLAAWSYFANGGRPMRLNASAIVISNVSNGTFDDFVPVRAQAVPRTTTFVDAAQGGQIERVLVDDGARVTKGQVLARLTNPAFQLDALARDAELQQRLNGIKEAELALQRQRVDDDTRLSESTFRAKLARSELEKQRALNRDGFVSDALVRRAEEESQFADERMAALTHGHQRSEALMSEQLNQLHVQSMQVRETLSATHRLLDALVVKAPADGTVTGLTLKPGQAVAVGARVAQIDGSDGFKLVGNIDEHYLPRVATGQTAVLASSSSSDPTLKAGRVLPQVVNGQFQVEFQFLEEPPAGLRRGQTVEVRLSLGVTTSALLLPNAAFLNDSGGAFVFRLDEDGRVARKTSVQLGRRNVRWVEVLGGLRHGDRVITSSYSDFVRHSAVSIEGP